MKKAELTLEIEGKESPRIKVVPAKLEVKKDDTVAWRKKGRDNYVYKIIFPEHSPFELNEFSVGKEGATKETPVLYDHTICGWKRFKYLIMATDGTRVLYLDPELIIPKNPKSRE